MKLSDILKTSCKSFSMKFLEINSFTKKLFTVFRQESWTKFYERVFLWTKKKIQYNFWKNLTQFTWNTLLYCLYNNKAKIWTCCYCKVWIAWLFWGCICWFCIMSWLCCHSRASLSLFCSCKYSDLNSRLVQVILEEKQRILN